jgi:hypothetical protein
MPRGNLHCELLFPDSSSVASEDSGSSSIEARKLVRRSVWFRAGDKIGEELWEDFTEVTMPPSSASDLANNVN